MADPLTCSLPNRVQYLPVVVYSSENFLISNLVKPADLFHSSLYPHFKAIVLQVPLNAIQPTAPLQDVIDPLVRRCSRFAITLDLPDINVFSRRTSCILQMWPKSWSFLFQVIMFPTVSGDAPDFNFPNPAGRDLLTQIRPGQDLGQIKITALKLHFVVFFPTFLKLRW